MNTKISLYLLRLSLGLLLWVGFLPGVTAQNTRTAATTLSEQLFARDSLLYDAALYTGDIKTVENLLAADLEWYKDQGISGPGERQSRLEFVLAMNRHCEARRAGGGQNIRRVVDKNSWQAFATGKDEALQLGVQRWYLITTTGRAKLIEVSKFSRHWTYKNGAWTITQQVDYLIDDEPENPAPAQVQAPDSALKIR
ncbi:MAG: hypothetical protein IT260_18545 [Saprospiraceae bacterium]|nr:hypothetical protein [Saprospiraceae bacterium]